MQFAWPFVISFATCVGLMAVVRGALSARWQLPWHLVFSLSALFGVLYALHDVGADRTKEHREREILETVQQLRRELSMYAGRPMLEVKSVLPSAKAVELAKLIRPDDGPYALALKATAEGRFEDARSFFTEAERFATDLRPLYAARGDMEGYAGAPAEQLKWIEKALALNPEDPELLIKKGVALMALGKPAEAESPLGSALTLAPDLSVETLAAQDLACAYLEQGDREKAKVFSDRALLASRGLEGTDDPLFAKTLTNVGSIEASLGYDSRPEAFFREALKHQGEACPAGVDRAWTLRALGELHHTRRNYREAEKALREALVLAQQCLGDRPEVAEFLTALASLYSDMQRRDEAKSLYLRAVGLVRQDPGYLRVRILQGYRDFLRGTGQAEQTRIVEDELAAARGAAPLKETSLILPTPQRAR